MAEYVMRYQGERVCDVFAREGTKDLYASAAKERIVRCRDCKHFAADKSDHENRWGWWCKRWDTDMVEPEGFCKWGCHKQ